MTLTIDHPVDLTHQSLTSEHYTPPWVFEMARYIMGSIRFDPFTSKFVNDWGAKADFIGTKEDCGFELLKKQTSYFQLNLSHQYPTVFCNPPSEKGGDAARAFRLLHAAWVSGAIEQAVFVAFSLDTLDQCCELTHSLPRLQLRNRLKYWAWNDVRQSFCEGNWSKKGSGKFYIEKATATGWWKVVDKDLVVQYCRASKDEAISVTDGNYLIWSNSPTKHSTMILLPPRTNAGWNECLERAQSFELPVEGYWNVPQFPTDLGAKNND